MDRRLELAGLGRVRTLSDGSALFADITGFTTLTADLSRRHGPRLGAETLAAVLNRVFGAVIGVIDEAGGSVISFAGDSVTCWFEGDNGHRATAVGVELVNVIHDLRDQEGHALEIKVAVASGTGRRLRVGNAAQSYLDVLAGEIVMALSGEAALLKAGEVVVTERVARAIRSRAMVRPVEEHGRVRYLVDGAGDVEGAVPHPDLMTLDRQKAQAWILPVVAGHLELGLDRLMGQLRNVVTLFVGFEGIDFAIGDEAAELFDVSVCRAQEVIASYEGMVLQALLDDKGAHIYAVFGASVSHEDDARRAVIAAFDMTKLPGAAPLRVGIASGVVFVGAYGGSTRMTYGVIGPSVNLSARLMQRAPVGGVYVTEEIASARGQRASFSTVGPTRLKGFEDPVILFEASPHLDRASAARPTGQGRLIGRDRERSLLGEALGRLHGGRGGAVLVEGPAGIGKSHLLTDFMDQARGMGTSVIVTAGEEIEYATAYYAWRSLLRQSFGGNDMAAEARLLEFVNADPWKAERVGLLRPIIASRVEDTYLTSGMEPDLRNENTQQLIVEIVRDVPRSDGPLMLVFDDGHWMDSASWTMAERVIHEIPAALVVIGTRPFVEGSASPPPEEYRHLMAEDDTVHIVLGELEPSQTLELVESCLGVASLPGPVAELILEHAEGHPYFSQEVGFALRDAGLLIIEDRESRLAPEVQDLREVDFPRSVQDMIIGRLDRLPVRQQSILKVASVIGREFSPRALVGIFPGEISILDVVESLHGLVPLDLVEPVLNDSERFRFRHAITRDIAYELLLFEQRHQLHAAVARSLEDEYADDPESVLAVVAYHYRHSLSPSTPGEDVDRALDYLGRAGRKSLRTFAHREAIGFLSDAVAIARGGEGDPELSGIKPTKSVPDRILARWEQDRAEAYLGMGRVDQSLQHFERALDLHGHPIGKSKVGVGARLMTAVVLQAAHRITRFQGRTLDPEAREDLIEAATAHERLMKIYYYANDPGALLTAAVSGLNLAGKSGDLSRAGPYLRQHEHCRRDHPPPRPGPHVPSPELRGGRSGGSDDRTRLGQAVDQRLWGGSG